MIELPESRTISKQMNEVLKDKTVLEVIIEASPHKFAFYSDNNKEDYPFIMEGQKITGCISHAGHIQLNMKDCFLCLTDGAYPRYVNNTDKPAKKHQLYVTFTDKSAFYVSVRMYGGIRLSTNGTINTDYYNQAISKPEPTSDEFTFEYFKSLCSDEAKILTAKTFLATEQRIPGLGNGVLQDILFNSGIDARININKLGENDLKTLYKSIRETLNEMCKLLGRDTETDFFGNCGNYRTILSKNTLGTACPKCGSEIKKASYMGGTIYFCEKCQRRY